jgi:hypothetical protein
VTEQDERVAHGEDRHRQVERVDLLDVILVAALGAPVGPVNLFDLDGRRRVLVHGWSARVS